MRFARLGNLLNVCGGGGSLWPCDKHVCFNLFLIRAWEVRGPREAPHGHSLDLRGLPEAPGTKLTFFAGHHSTKRGRVLRVSRFRQPAPPPSGGGAGGSRAKQPRLLRRLVSKHQSSYGATGNSFPMSPVLCYGLRAKTDIETKDKLPIENTEHQPKLRDSTGTN